MDVQKQRFAPTPLYLLDTDAQGNRIFIKREDLLPYSFGGNKVRIGIEYMRDMKDKGCDHLVAYGNPRSNLCRVLSNLCAGQGIPITILSPADDSGLWAPTLNSRLCKALGARVVPCLKAGVAKSVDKALSDISREGRKPYYIYGDRLGKGNEAVPTAAYAGMHTELAAQQAALQARFGAIFLATGTGMTQAGLLCGQAMAGNTGSGCRVIGISIAREAADAIAHVKACADAYAKANGMEKVPAERIEVYDDFRETYGQYGGAVDGCIRQAMARYGLPLDGTYTGKAFHGMRGLMQRWGWQGRDLLFLHTGGAPLFFDAVEQWEGGPA